MKKTLVLIIGFLIITGCSSLRVNVDYDPEFNLLEQKSFAIVHHNKEGEDTLFNDRFIEALKKDLKAKAYVEVDEGSASLIFVFHVNVESKVDIDTDYQMVGYGRYGYGGHMVATTRSYKYTKGTLIVDALNPKDNKIVWRAITTDILKSYDTPQQRTAYIQSVVKETMKDFPSKQISK
ncbi:MAG: hypothetical protein COA44_03405 [Arcobacter sp.]|nr:MAG: hypothetical protein COA44_03405 [Arcobacter sp.]